MDHRIWVWWLFWGWGCGDKAPADTGASDSALAVDSAAVAPILCEATLPANVWVVRDAQRTSATGAVAWICAGGALTSSGTGGAFFVEGGGTLVLDGGDARVYARSGASLTLNVSGTEVHHEDGAAIVVNAINDLYRCDEVRFLADDVPLGCDD